MVKQHLRERFHKVISIILCLTILLEAAPLPALAYAQAEQQAHLPAPQTPLNLPTPSAARIEPQQAALAAAADLPLATPPPVNSPQSWLAETGTELKPGPAPQPQALSPAAQPGPQTTPEPNYPA